VAASGLRPHAQREAQPALDAGETGVAPGEQQCAALLRDLAGLRAVDADAQRDAAWLIAGQAHHDALFAR